MKQLGHTEIPATVISLEDLEYELAEIDENLIRSDISVVDQGNRFEHRQRIWEAIYPESGMGKAPKNNANRKNEIISFNDAAAKIGTSNDEMTASPQNIKRKIKVARCQFVFLMTPHKKAASLEKWTLCPFSDLYYLSAPYPSPSRGEA